MAAWELWWLLLPNTVSGLFLLALEKSKFKICSRFPTECLLCLSCHKNGATQNWGLSMQCVWGMATRVRSLAFKTSNQTLTKPKWEAGMLSKSIWKRDFEFLLEWGNVTRETKSYSNGTLRAGYYGIILRRSWPSCWSGLCVWQTVPPLRLLKA